MLPSTGKFKEINCPFYDSGLCERPYCHYRHVRKDPSEALRTTVSSVNTANATLALDDNEEIFHQIVSEAVRKVLEKTDLPSALACPSGSNAVENVSRNLVTKVAEALVPPITAVTSAQQTYNVPTTTLKVPSYKPTPISVLKSRHIPIPYSPSLTKSCSVLRKRPNSDESSVQKKFKKQNLENANNIVPSYTSTLISSKSYDPASVLNITHTACESASDSAQYSPAPVKGWKDNGFKYTPSSIETLAQNNYIPSNSHTVQGAVAEYEPTEKLESSVEPTYEPLATSGCTVEAASYEPSRVSNLEPEYQPLLCDNTAKEYVPTEISKLESFSNIDLDISPEIDLLHDLLHDELNDSHTDETGKEKTSDSNKFDSACRCKHLHCEKKSSSVVEKTKKNHERHKHDGNRKKSENEKKKGEVRKTSDTKKELSTNDGENEKRRDSAKKRSDTKKPVEVINVSSITSSKKRTDPEKKKSDSEKKKDDGEKRRDDSEKKKDDGEKRRDDCEKKKDDVEKRRDNNEKKKDDNEKKRNESRKKSDNNESERKRKDDKRLLSEKEHGERHRKKSDSDKKTMENEIKKSEIDRKKSAFPKNTCSEKNSSNTHNCKHADKNSSEHKNGQKVSHSGHSEHSQSSVKTVSEKKCDESRKNTHSHKKYVPGHSSEKHQSKYVEGKNSRSEEHSKVKIETSKRRKSVTDESSDPKKKNISNKKLKTESSKKYILTEESNHGSEESDMENGIWKDVTVPNDIVISSSDNEDDVAKECYRIFQEEAPKKDEKKPVTLIQPPTVDEDHKPVPGKHRKAYDGAQNSSIIRTSTKRSSIPNPSQTVSDRFQKARAMARAKAKTQVAALTQGKAEAHEIIQAHSQPCTNSSVSCHTQSSIGSPSSFLSQKMSDVKLSGTQSASPAPPPPVARKRIAHVPNVSLLLDEKIKVQQKMRENLSGEVAGKVYGSSTVAQTVQKGSHRVAHMPTEELLTRPVVKGIGGKIPLNIRQNYLDILVDEYLKMSTSDQEAYDKAEKEEKAILSRSTSRVVYTSLVSNTISRLRKAAQNNDASTSGKIDGRYVNRTVSHTSMLAGKVGTKGSWSIEKPRKPPASVANKTLYDSLSQFVLDQEQLKQNGFPMSHDEEKGVALIYNFYKKPFVPKDPSQRMCARCSKIYCVNQQGHALQSENCYYHWGRLFQSKTRGGWEARYNCCQSYAGSHGCSLGNCHVSDNFDPTNLRGFVKTLSKEKPPDGDYGVYALDCEMCYTTLGLELTRVTVINSDLNVVYETLVKPENKILDYNTRFSGIKEEDLAEVTTNIYEVQSVLLSLFNDKTILIGHSLESDFKALKIIHGMVVDTSVVYPHKMGPPKKKALKTLCREYLQKIIQENDGGHDSAEDARAAMELVLFKVKEDLKSSW